MDAGRRTYPESLAQVADKPRSRARWLNGTGREPLASAIFLPLVAPGSLQGNLLKSELLIDSFTSCSVHGRLEELVDGTWLVNELGMEAGPEVGRLQSLLHLAEISGETTTVKEAQQWLLDRQKAIDNSFH